METSTSVAEQVTIERAGRSTYRILADGHTIGSATFARAGDVVHSCGWGIAEQWQGKGVMSHVLPLLLQSEAAAGVTRFTTVIADDNTASQRLAAKCGFVRETSLDRHRLRRWSLLISTDA